MKIQHYNIVYIFLFLFVMLSFHALPSGKIVAKMGDAVLTYDEATSIVKYKKSFSSFFDNNIDENILLSMVIKNWARETALNNIIEKYNIAISEEEVKYEWTEIKGKLAAQNGGNLPREIFELKGNNRLSEILKKALLEINPKGEVLINQDTEHKIFELFTKNRNELKEALPNKMDRELYITFKTFIVSFRKPEDIDYYFNALPDNWEDMFDSSRESISRDIKIQKLKEILALQRLPEIDMEDFNQYMGNAAKGKGIEARKEAFKEYFLLFANYNLEDIIYEEIRNQLQIPDKSIFEQFNQQYPKPARDAIKPSSSAVSRDK